MKIRIGTRKSKLALAQTTMVAERIKAEFPKIETELVYISTAGDRILDKPLSKIGGKGVFVSEIEKALLNDRIDIAVHSAKDMPSELADGLEISGVLKRGDSRDVIITRKGTSVKDKPDFVIGTGSLRRRKNLGRIYPKIQFADIRGNVDTRLKKLLSGEYDGIVLAGAGLERLGFNKDREFEFQYLDIKECLPAPCQAIIAVESRKNDIVTPVIRSINDKDTFNAFETERHIINILNGDCGLPLGAYSYIENGEIQIYISADGEKVVYSHSEVKNRLKCAEELIKCL